MGKNSKGGWTTKNEMEYINVLVKGGYLFGTCHVREIPIQGLLLNYIQSAKRRVAAGTFGDVDGEEVLKYARSFLMEEADGRKRNRTIEDHSKNQEAIA